MSLILSCVQGAVFGYIVIFGKEEQINFKEEESCIMRHMKIWVLGLTAEL